MPLPWIQPIAPIASKVPFDDPAWQFELKYDGFRALCYLERRRKGAMTEDRYLKSHSRSNTT
jgi:ATP-dependent DNA ligase